MKLKLSNSRTFLWIAGGLAASALAVSADEWLDVKDAQGRKLTVNIQKVEDGNVTFKTRNGKSYTYPIKKFSVVDQLALKKWKPPVGSNSPVEEDAKLKKGASSDTSTTFQTKHFDFEVIGDGGEAVLKKVATHFEAVHWSFAQLPTDVTPKPADGRFKVKAFAKLSDFEVASKDALAEGQPATYNLSDDRLVAPLELLESSPALTREIAYLLLGERLTQLPPWLAVAITEYAASAPFKTNRLDFSDPMDNIRGFLKSEYGIADKNVPMMSPAEVLQLDYSQLRAPGLEGNKARSSALLAYHFFTELDNKGKPMDKYMLALKTGTDPATAMEVIADGRDEAKLSDDLRLAYIPKKLRIAFIK